ncbi:reverse transcriptase [Tanacetum coccineum]|uniref:Reverse transcriptase n=1 Tax=Tanacetum coccineum TaxID=301880 RepID=A0ABQ5DFQ9_9ASTR
MVNTRTNEPRVLDETLRSAVLQVVQEANAPVKLIRIQALMMFQTFATGEFTRISGGEGTSNRGGGYGRLTKLDFPKFSGDDVNGWLFRVQQFFLIDNVQEDQKIRLVSMHLYDKALEWHKQFIKIHGENVLWSEYEKEIIARFNSVFEDPMVEIKNLKQDGEVKVYQEQFEVLLNRLDLTESYAVSFFIGGLKSEIGMPVRMSNSGTYANRYVSSSTPVTKPVLALPSATTENVGKVVKTGFSKQVTQKELEEKRAKGLCFYCDQKYAPGHKCPGQLYSLEVSVDEEDQAEEVCIDTEVREDTQVATYTESFPQISLHALSGVSKFQTMRVGGYVAKRLPCQLSATTPLSVDVANGSKMVSSSECKTFKWTLQGNEYEAHCMLLPLGGYDMVLGIQWLSTLGDINCNFKNLTMKFNYQGKKIVEKQLMQIQGETAESFDDNLPSFDDNLPLKQLLSNYEDVFAMPTELPPPRAHDHTITLFPNTPPVTVRPYRLPPNQKDVVEQNGEGIVRCWSNQRKSKPFFFTYCDGKEERWHMENACGL